MSNFFTAVNLQTFLTFFSNMLIKYIYLLVTVLIKGL